jgi:protocatechuate 3,4-dioxygenase, alpha subunit
VIPSPGQTVGPFFHLGLPIADGHELVPSASPDAIRLHGRVLDGEGNPVPDAVIEIWQTDPDGNVAGEPGSMRRDGWTFTGWGRAATDPDGHYSFSTVEPGPTEAGRPPFFAVTIFARGLLDRLFTRAYLPNPELFGADPVLSALPPERQETLVTVREARGLRFDIRLQGEGETVFLSYPGQRQSWA